MTAPWLAGPTLAGSKSAALCARRARLAKQTANEQPKTGPLRSNTSVSRWVTTAWEAPAVRSKNRFAALNLRTTLGACVGTSLFEGSPSSLSSTVRSHVEESFGGGEDRSYMGMTWSVRSESQYFGGDSRLYVNHHGVVNLSHGGESLP